jgi:hypothetical protein
VSLIVTAPTNDVKPGDMYTLSPDASPGSTFFDQYLVPGSGVSVDSGASGQVMITAASVPEPSSLVYGLAAMLIVVSARWLRRSPRSEKPPI